MARKKASTATAPARAAAHPPLDFEIDWVAALTEPYLRGFIPAAEREGPLLGFRLLHPQLPARSDSRHRNRGSRFAATSRATSAGFFVGYLVGERGYEYLHPAPPECLVFAFVEPLAGAPHQRLVAAPESLFRSTAAYIRWLTHRPPHFQLFDSEPVALVRHFSMRDWPREKYEHFSRNFFIETLAWLVRSGLVRRLLADPLTPRSDSENAGR